MASQRVRNFYFALLQTRLGLVLSWLFRSWHFSRQSTVQFTKKIRAIWQSREFVNYTYNLDAHSRDYLPYFISNIIGCNVLEAENAIRELEEDQELAAFHFDCIEKSNRRWSSDPALKPGRLLLNYALIRLTKPKLVFEAGLDKGFGAIILNRALRRNSDEGFEAAYVGVEYRSDRPAFLIEKYPYRIGQIIYKSWSDAFQSLDRGSVDFFFYDAISRDEELEKFVTFSDRFSINSITVCAWSFKTLYKNAARRNCHVSVFPALAKDHWFDGNDLCVIHPQKVNRLRFQDEPKL